VDLRPRIALHGSWREHTFLGFFMGTMDIMVYVPGNTIIEVNYTTFSLSLMHRLLRERWCRQKNFLQQNLAVLAILDWLPWLAEWPYKSSAVAEMDDHLATIDMGRKVGGCCAPFHGGAGTPFNTMSPGWGLPPYQVASWSIQPFGHNRHGLKIGGCAPFLGELVPI